MADSNSNFVNPYERIWKTRDLRELEPKPIELENNLSQFRRGLGAFGKEMQATGYGLAALGAQGLENVIGENKVTSGITDWGLKGYQQAIDESQSGYNAPNVADVSNIKGVGDFTDWAGYQLGKGLPMLGSLALSGGVGGAVARLGANAGIKQIAKSAVGDVVKKGVATKALQAAKGQIVTKAMQETAAKALRDSIVKGTMTGGFAGSFGLEGGLAFGEQVGEGVAPKDAVKSAIAVGGINGALEFLPFYGVAKSIGLGQYAKNSIKNIIKNDAALSKKAVALATAKELGSRAAKGGLVGAGAEGITEGLQELTSIAGLRWAKEDPLFAELSDDDWNRIGNAMAAGALVGGVAAGAGATLGGPQVQAQPPTTQPPTVTPPAAQPPSGAPSQTRAQALDSLRNRVDTELEAAQKRGDTKRVQELQAARDILVANQERIVEEAPIQEAPIQEAPVQESPVQEPPAPVVPAPSEPIRMQQGEEVILTPGAAPTTRVTPTPEEVEALRQRMGPRPEAQPTEDTTNAQEVQAQTEAPVKPGAAPLQSRALQRPETRPAPTFYSALERVTQEAKQEKAAPAQWESTLDNMVKKGLVKQEELDWSGTKEWLKEQKESVTKEALLQHVKDNTLEVKELELGAGGLSARLNNSRNWEIVDSQGNIVDTFEYHYAENPAEALEHSGLEQPRHTRLTLPGGENQRELVLTVPSIEPFKTEDTTHYGDVGGGKAVAWVRFNDRVDEDGKKTLFVEEIQSKRHQEGKKKGYIEKDLIPLNELRIEKTLKDNGWHFYDKDNHWVHFVSEYDAVTEEEAFKVAEQDFKKDPRIIDRSLRFNINEKRVPNAPFKQEIAGSGQTLSGWAGLAFKRMLKYAVENGYDKVAFTNGEQQAKRYQGAGEKFLKRLYDETIPNELNKYVKKWGAKVDKTQMEFGDESASVHSVEITPAMRDSVMRGQPLFSKQAGKQKIVTPEMDAKYLAAVERGDMEAAQRMVDKTAKQVGYTILTWHGTPSPERIESFSPEKIGSWTGDEGLWAGKFYWSTPNKDYAKMYQGKKDGKRQGQLLRLFARVGNIHETVPFGTPANDSHDTVFVRDEYGNIVEIGVRDPNQLKSADPVTYDAAGNIIPLSQRFNTTTPDIRYTKQPDTTNIPLQDFHSNINSIMGEGWLQQAIEAGLIEVIEGKGPNGEAGSWAGDHIRLYTDSMPKDGSPAGVLLHEGKHATFKDILGDSLAAYVNDLHTLAKNGNKVAQDAITHAVIAAADSMGIKHNLYDGGTKADFDAVRALIEEKYPGLLSEEELAYFVQHGTESQTGQGFLRRLINAIKAWLMQTRLGQRAKELGIGFELTDGMAVEWAKMGLNRSLAEAKQAAKVRARVEKQAATLPASARLGKALAALEDFDPLYSFAGENALTANLSLQQEAELRIKNGEDKESVRQDTGWFLNEADGKWRFEIDDSKASWGVTSFENITESELFGKEYAVSLADVLNHPELFKAYPQLKNISVIKREAFEDTNQRMQGWFSEDNLQIGITPYAKNPMSTLLHELQHVIQMYEGFARGGSEESVWGYLPKDTKENIAKGLLEKYNRKIREIQQQLDVVSLAESKPDLILEYGEAKRQRDITYEAYSNATNLSDEERSSLAELWTLTEDKHKQASEAIANELAYEGVNNVFDLSWSAYTIIGKIIDGKINDLNKYKNKLNKNITDVFKLITSIKTGDEKVIRKEANLFELYRRLAGETEARLTQARQGMTEKKRALKSPESMQEYPYNEQIVVMPGTKTSGEVFYSMGIQELRQRLWTDPTDVNQELVNKPGLLQRFRGNFIDFFAEMEKKSKDIYDTYSLLRSKKAGRIEQARQEYYFPLRDKIANSPWSAKEMGDMLAARHHKVDKVNIRLAERASYGFTKDLLKALPKAKQKELQQARINIKAGKMPDGSDYVDANGNKIDMAATTKHKLMFDLMNKYVQHEIADTNGRQVLREEWELFKDAAGGFSNGGVGKTKVRTVDDVLQMADRDRAKFDEIANLFDALNRHTLDILEDGGLITAKEHARLLVDKSAYAPLRRESYNVNREIELLFQKAGQGGSKQVSTRTGTSALSEPALVLQNALAATEAAAAAAERNLANKELYKVIVADREGWKPWFTIVEKDKYVTHDEDGFLQEKHATASNRADITLINDGKKLVIRPNMHNERAMGFVRAVNNLDAQILSGPMQILGWTNQIVRWVNVSFSPIFLMMNAVRDPFTALYNIQASKAGEYTKEIFNPKTYKDSFRALKKVFMDGNRDPNDKDVQWVERWELAGGRTSFVETLREMDDTWRSFDAQVARRQGNMKQLMQAKDKWIDGIENLNILFENVMRFSSFKVLIEKGVSEKEAARISQDLTTNFTRRGYKTQMLGTWWLFFNATVQGNYQVLRNLMGSKKVQAMVGGTIVLGLLLDLLGRAIDDDWDKIPEWDKERFIILPVKVGGDFVRIPAPWVYNVVWRTGGLLGEALSGVKKPQDAVLDIAAMTTTVFNPLGKPGSIAQAIAPTAADPFVQILENKDFAGNPLGPEGFPGAGSKANSELLWSSTPKGYQSIARWVNEFTGGSAVESGVIDLRPADYQLLASFLTGSLGRFMSDATFGVKEALDKGIEGPRDIPVIKEIFSDPYDPLKSQKYHTNIAGIYGAHKLEQMYLRGPDRDLIKLQEVRKNRGEELRMYSQAQDVERQLKSLRVRLRAAQNREDREREKEIKDRMGKIQEKFNERYQQRMG